MGSLINPYFGLTDFLPTSFSCFLSGLDADRIPIAMCGTLEYISPEVMRCSHASPASDMWSAGVILYMMLTGGVRPFWAESEYRMQKRIIRGTFR